MLPDLRRETSNQFNENKPKISSSKKLKNKSTGNLIDIVSRVFFHMADQNHDIKLKYR